MNHHCGGLNLPDHHHLAHVAHLGALARKVSQSAASLAGLQRFSGLFELCSSFARNPAAHVPVWQNGAQTVATKTVPGFNPYCFWKAFLLNFPNAHRNC